MPFTRKQLGVIYHGCDGQCYYCGNNLDPFGDWEPDHMMPRSKGGSDYLHNIVAACRPCNRSKGNRTVDEFKAAIIRRALNHLTAASEALERYQYPEPDVVALLDDLEAVGNKLAQLTIVFHGEAATLPRKDDPAFTAFDGGEAEDEINVVQ